MHIYQLGWAWRHSSDFKIERPAGHFGTQLILVRTTGRIVMTRDDINSLSQSKWNCKYHEFYDYSCLC